ncbi:MAG: FKBP-type peptidyl-prolyl cis-trans isomerase [Actinomycetes bacterium]
MRKSHAFTFALSVFATLSLLTACTSQPESLGTSSSSSSSQTNPAKFPAVSGAAGSEPVIATPSGTPPIELMTRDLISGSGPAATPESTVTVNYVGVSWSDGAIFDSSWKRGTPAEFSLAQVIPGWAQGLTGAQVGTRREIIIPPTLGYGETGQGSIKPNETLVFVVDILGVK